MEIKEIASKLKELGLRTLGQSIWVQDSTTTPAYANVTAPVKSGQFGPYMELHISDKEFIAVRLQKGAPVNKASYDIFIYTADRDWPSTDAEKKRFPNVTPIVKGQKTAFAH